MVVLFALQDKHKYSCYRRLGESSRSKKLKLADSGVVMVWVIVTGLVILLIAESKNRTVITKPSAVISQPSIVGGMAGAGSSTYVAPATKPPYQAPAGSHWRLVSATSAKSDYVGGFTSIGLPGLSITSNLSGVSSPQSGKYQYTSGDVWELIQDVTSTGQPTDQIMAIIPASNNDGTAQFTGYFE